ncbi:MAG: rod shape-determining protein MreC [Lactococcus plantarum]|nr:rod shape-determining protein MreC [Lactococcus plantarum]MDN6069642.1 rod shape-determining protein MreC [Lactococcus plantarum]MDN6084494.1 rod shape-determining protein MreC [Lactococcus plantarum]
MKKINFSKIIIMALIMMIAACIAILVSAQHYKEKRSPSAMSVVINESVGGIDRVIGVPFDFFQNKLSDLGQFMATYEQNASLSKQVTELRDDSSEVGSLKAENKALKSALNLQNTLTNYDKLSANVIVRSPNAWNDTMTIDKGKSDGLAQDMIVMSNGGVVGRVVQVNQTTSKVALLTSDKALESKIPVRLGTAENPAFGLITGYDAQQNAFIVTQISSDLKFNKGDAVVTSGLGGNSPADLTVGEIIGEKQNTKSVDREVYVKPAGQFSNMQFAFVIKRGLQ